MTARAKGKVERPFRTVKEAHETLYHFHKPDTEAQANAWLCRYLLRYNEQQHRSQPHARLADWLANLPAEGLREMCTWEQFCRFAREPERRKVGVDARVTIAGTAYEVDPQLAGETVLLLGACLTTPSTSNTKVSVLAPTLPWPGRFPCIDTERSSAASARSAPTVSVTRPISSPAPGRPGGDDLQLQPPTVHRPAWLRPTQPFDADALEYHFPTTVAAKLAIARSWACR